MFSNHPVPAASCRSLFRAARRPHTAIAVIVASATFAAAALAANELPEAIAAAPGETLIATIHAEGAQLYECKADAAGKLIWQFREPIATLLVDNKTIGRHFAGPSWELEDGSAVSGRVAARAAGASAADIPLLKLSVTTQRDRGMLVGVTTIQRLNTKGGVAEGACERTGALLSVPYSADYAFYKKARSTQLPHALRFADAGAATGNRAPAPRQAATTSSGSPNVKTANDVKAPVGNKIESCPSPCRVHPHYGNNH
jgi:uncharacterized protein DUF3455